MPDSATHCYIMGVNAWYIMGVNAWYIMGVNPWYIIACKLTEADDTLRDLQGFRASYKGDFSAHGVALPR